MLQACMTAVAQAHRPPMARAGRTLLWSITTFGAASIGCHGETVGTGGVGSFDTLFFVLGVAEKWPQIRRLGSLRESHSDKEKQDVA